MECMYFFSYGVGAMNFKSVPQILLGLVMLFGFNSRINIKSLNQRLDLSGLY